jgi:homoserine kinase
MADAVFNLSHASLLVLGLARGDLGLISRGLPDRLHQPRRAHLYPRSWELVQQARSLGALGATISGAGPTVLVWCDFESTGAVAARLGEFAEGWADVMRVPFSAAGAEIRAL